jgi:Fungal specific transcription factor domain
MSGNFTLQFEPPTTTSPPSSGTSTPRLKHGQLTSVLDGNYCTGSANTPPEILSPDLYRDVTSFPPYMTEQHHEYPPRPYRTSPFDCSIPQLLSPVSFQQQLAVLPTSVDPLVLGQPLFQPPPSVPPLTQRLMPTGPLVSSYVEAEVMIKDEESTEDDTIGELVREMIPARQTALVPTHNQETAQYINLATFSNLSTIPPSLSVITSPLLDENPAFRHLYHHFIQNTCRVLVPYDDHQNPFRTILAQMALHPSATHLLSALLASSAAHRAGQRGEQPPKYLISNLLQTTLEGLRKALDNPAEACQDTTLATAIALSSYNIISSDVSHWRMHLDGAREIILHRRRTETSPSREVSVRSFLFKWFAYLDVIAGASGLTLKEHNYESAVELIEDVTETKANSLWAPAKVDTFTGFTQRLLPLLLRIGKLAHQKRVAARMGIDLLLDPAFDFNVHSLELDLDAAEFEFDHIVIPTAEHIDPELETQLRACNEAFHAAARIHIQRRLRNWTAEQVHPTVEHVFDAIKKVPKGSGPEICLLYPLFSAGVEATGELRVLAEERMLAMEKIGIGNVMRAKKVMLATWEQSDIHGSVNWEDVMEEMGWDLSLA